MRHYRASIGLKCTLAPHFGQTANSSNLAGKCQNMSDCHTNDSPNWHKTHRYQLGDKKKGLQQLDSQIRLHESMTACSQARSVCMPRAYTSPHLLHSGISVFSGRITTFLTVLDMGHWQTVKAQIRCGIFNPFYTSNTNMGHWLTVKAQIRRAV